MYISFVISVALVVVHACTAHVIAVRDSTTTVPHYLPIPSSAAGPPIPASGYRVESFGKGAYMVTDGTYQAVFVVSTKGVVVIDVPPTIGHNLVYAIGNTTSLPITHLVYSHSHADHIGGVSLLLDAFPNHKIKTIAHSATASQLSAVADPNRPVPKTTFQDTYSIQQGNQTIQLSYKGLNHIDGNIFIYLPEQKVLMLVDVVYPGWTPFDRLGEVSSVPGFIKAHDQILEYDFEHYVGGHLDRSGARQDVETQREYINNLFENCKHTIELSATADPALSGEKILSATLAENPGNSWAAFKAYLDTITSHCANITNNKWASRLAAADVYQVSNAGVMIESLRIDYGILGPFGNK